MEKKLLGSLVSSREAYDKLRPYIDDSDFTDKGRIIYRKAIEFYENDPLAAAVDVELLKAALRRDVPKHAALFEQLVDEFEPASLPNLLREVVSLKKHNTAVKLSSALLMDNDAEITPLLEQYALYSAGELLSPEQEEDRELFYQTDLAAYLKENVRAGKRIKLYPKSLNDAIGGKGVLPGHHIVIFAVPETGKSLFAVNLAAGMVRAGHKVLYISNEEPTLDLVFRFFSRMTKRPKEWVEANVEAAQKIAKGAGYDNLIVYGTSRGTPKEIHALIEKYKPEIVFADQMWKLAIDTKSDKESSAITAASHFMRATAKKYGVVAVSITQAGDSASGKLVLENNDVFQSNTSVPGDADLMIGIGANDDFLHNNRRMIHLPKNKINGNHIYFPVNVHIDTSRVTSI